MNDSKISTDTVDQSNVNVAELGRKAAALWNSSERDGQKGDAFACVALFTAYHTMNFQAVVTGKKGEIEQTIDFDLDDYANKQCTSANGQRDNKATLARTVAVFTKVFGITEPNAAQKQRLMRTMKRVIALAAAGYDETQIKLSGKGFLQVPYPVMHDEPKDDADERAIRDWKNNNGDFETLNGKDGMSLASLDRRIAPKGDSRSAQSATASKGVEFTAAVQFVTTTVARLMDENADDDMPAPNEEVRKLLWSNLQTLQSYFKADPIEVKEDKNAKGKNAKAA